MAKKKKLGRQVRCDAGPPKPEVPAGAVLAVPPPDDPMARNAFEQEQVGSVEAAALRVEAIRRTRLMPPNDELPGKKPR